MTYHFRLSAILISFLVIHGCSKNHDNELREIIAQNKLHHSFQYDIDPTTLIDREISLGGALFFSPNLSISGDIACSTCHHPEHAGADGLSLPIGVSGIKPEITGPDRLNAIKDKLPNLQIEGQIPRNSPTVFNSNLYRNVVFWDGRVQYVEKDNQRVIQTGFYGPAQSNPSGYPQLNLLQAQARLPITSVFEMKGFSSANNNNHEIEQRVISNLRSGDMWCRRFAQTYNPEASCEENINLLNVTKALSAFQASLLFIDSPFQSYIDGNQNALSDAQKMGAIAFFTSIEEGGAGCIACHSGKHLTNEKFYNLNIPASGLGKNAEGMDFGRSNVDRNAPEFSFRTPGLLNVAETAPYFHNGSALTLDDAIRAHTKERDKLNFYVIENEGVNYAKINSQIQKSFNQADHVHLLPEKLSENSIKNLVSFLESLSDPCLKDKSCYEKFMHETIKTSHEVAIRNEKSSTPKRGANKEAIKQPELDCKNTRATKSPEFGFTIRADIFNHERSVGLIRKGWLQDNQNNAGMSISDLDYDCLDEIVFDAGKNGIIFYQQTADGDFRKMDIEPDFQPSALNPMLLDADGDYKVDLFIGNYGQGSAEIFFNVHKTTEDKTRFSEIAGPVINVTASDINTDGQIDLALAFWRSYNSIMQPHIWLGDGNGNFDPAGGYLNIRQAAPELRKGEDQDKLTQSMLGSPDMTFTPNFTDIDNDNDDDLLLAADFIRSQVLKNENGNMIDITDKEVINDSNGMGAAIADFDLDGDMDWFVTSIVDEEVSYIDGHRLYTNQGNGVFTQSPIPNKTNEWSWGACAADFDNDGDQDIFYTSGYADRAKTATYESELQEKSSNEYFEMMKRFSSPKLTFLINDGKGNFTDETKALGLDIIFSGRGIACFDYLQDGDIDVVINPYEGAPILLENFSPESNNWISLKIVGAPGNTEAFGSKVFLYTKNNVQYREVRFENNYISRNPSQLHFGLGAQDEIEKIEITGPAPDYIKIVLTKPEINQLHIISLR